LLTDWTEISEIDTGRSPTYILRQLLAFKTGARSGEMIDAAAYAASLEPIALRRMVPYRAALSNPRP
jgi:cytochrome c553